MVFQKVHLTAVWWKGWKGTRADVGIPGLGVWPSKPRERAIVIVQAGDEGRLDQDGEGRGEKCVVLRDLGRKMFTTKHVR